MALAAFALVPSNLLLLDEASNHLDAQTIEVLTGALQVSPAPPEQSRMCLTAGWKLVFCFAHLGRCPEAHVVAILKLSRRQLGLYEWRAVNVKEPSGSN